jgi:type IV pilus assembly protein PilV
MSARQILPRRIGGRHQREQGAAMIEVLISMLIVAFGIMGMFGMQTQATVSQMESYQRAQALVLVHDMIQRMEANPAQIATYVAADIGVTPLTNCAAPPTTADRDKCEWAALLQGSAELGGTSKVGAMIGARGCISQPDPLGAPQTYLVAVVWQGVRETGAPAASCGTGQYGSEALRRAATAVIQIATLS